MLFSFRFAKASLHSSSTKHKDEVKPSHGHSKVVQKLLSALTILVRLCRTLNLSISITTSQATWIKIERFPILIFLFLKPNIGLTQKGDSN